MTPLSEFIKRSEEAKAAGKLLWAPPAQVGPQTLEAPSGTTFYAPSVVSTSGDAVLKLPATVRKRGIQVSAARHLRVVGGEINLTGGNLTETSLRTGTNSGSLFAEGLLLNGGEAAKDLMNVSGTSGAGPWSLFPDLYIQRCRGEKIHGTSAGEHADLFQPQGSMGGFYAWYYTGYSQYQGFYLIPEKPVASVYIDYANFGYEAGGDPVTYLLWFLRKFGATSEAYPASYDAYLGENVYVQPKEGQKLTQTCWPPPGTLDTSGNLVGAEEFELEGGKALRWPTAARIHGYVREGPPPGGDFVKASEVGAAYASPGYLSASRVPLRVTTLTAASSGVHGLAVPGQQVVEPSMTIASGAGNTVLEVEARAEAVTVEVPFTAEVDGRKPAVRVVEVPQGQTKLVGPFPSTWYAQPDGSTQVNFTGAGGWVRTLSLI